jgi:hypothetical protein
VKEEILDKYDSLRSLPLPSVASTLGIDLQRFKTRKGGELYGSCPIHRPKQNQTSFSYAADGRYHCFSCNAKGRGADEGGREGIVLRRKCAG